MRVAPIERVGDAAVVSVAMEAPDAMAAGSYGLARYLYRQTSTRPTAAAGRLIDERGELVYDTVRASESGDGVVGTEVPVARPGEIVEFSFATTAPEADTADVLLPYFGLFPGIEVVDSEGSDRLEVPADAVIADPIPLQKTVVSYDDSSTTEEVDEVTTVRITSDVLFATGSADLGGEAQARIREIAEQVASSSAGGTVRVIGHTDDVDTEEYNQSLSERRADAVGSVLRDALGDGFAVETEGRGEREPIAQGTSEEARRANRRVEIVFDGATPIAGEEQEESKIPDADVPVAEGADAVRVETTGGVHDVSAVSVERRGRLLVGMLRVEAVNQTYDVSGILGDAEALPESAKLSWTGLYDEKRGARQLTLLTGEGWAFPVEYAYDDGADQRGELLADAMTLALDEDGDAYELTVIWPDPGTDTVTIEAAGAWRLEDVPVTEGG
ncbi:OmpA family protein [Microbacterium tumbae]